MRLRGPFRQTAYLPDPTYVNCPILAVQTCSFLLTNVVAAHSWEMSHLALPTTCLVRDLC